MAKKTGVLVLTLVSIFWAADARCLGLEEFQAHMQKHLRSLPGKSVASVHIEVLGGSDTLFTHNASSRMNPASSTKLITTLAALEKMGPAFTFSTKVYSQGDDLVIQGNGDPYLVSERLWLLAKDVARFGLKKVNSIKINNSNFSENYKGLMGWDNSGEPFTAVVSATSLNFNSLEIHVIPVPEGKARIEVGPVANGYARIVGSVAMVDGNRRNVTVRPLRTEGDKEIFEISGTLGRSASASVYYASVASPESYVAHVFAAMLRENGVSVAKDFGGSSFARIPASANLVASQESLPLLDQVRLYNTFSNNFMTEQVFQAMGAYGTGEPASLSKSRQVAMEYLKARPNCTDSEIDNGSGLSWETKVSARCFVELLQNSYRDFRIFADFLGSLPIGGQTGTLKSRFRKVGPSFEPWKVRAKTGTLWSRHAVTSLVGFTQAASGQLVAFALVLNDPKPGPAYIQSMKDWEDKCVEYIQQLRL